jgi:hypothetical protein
MGRSVPVQLPDAVIANLVHCHRAASGLVALNPQLSQEFFEIGIVYDDFTRWLSLRNGLDGTFIEGLEEAHLGDGVFLGAGEPPAILACPGVQRGLVDEDFERKGELAVDGNHIGELAAGVHAALGAISLEKIILIDVAVGGRIALDAAHGIGTSHGWIIEGGTVEVNAGVRQRLWCRNETNP